MKESTIKTVANELTTVKKNLGDEIQNKYREAISPYICKETIRLYDMNIFNDIHNDNYEIDDALDELHIYIDELNNYINKHTVDGICYSLKIGFIERLQKFEILEYMIDRYKSICNALDDITKESSAEEGIVK